MDSLTLQQAATFLKIHPVTLQEKARAGEIPGAKIGKCWVFLEIDLVDYVRSQYRRRALQGAHERNITCHSSNAKTRPAGGSKSSSTDERYNAVLGLTTKSKPRNSTTG
uniref:Helix-turn-helix domain-containing protein n=1 Tax=Dechloromonas aromatica (strain RCB) TaxID=159087 RepID=Q47H87_DECAR